MYPARAFLEILALGAGREMSNLRVFSGHRGSNPTRASRILREISSKSERLGCLRSNSVPNCLRVCAALGSQPLNSTLINYLEDEEEG